MPIKHAALKALRKSRRATMKNRQVKEAIKKLVKTGERAIAAEKFDEAKALIPKLAKAVDKAAHRDIIKRNKANRIKARFARLLRSRTTNK